MRIPTVASLKILFAVAMSLAVVSARALPAEENAAATEEALT
ncbi:hypothetical protein ACG7TL_008180 [Trametes sanguinea]